MKPTLQNIGDQVRALLADTHPAGGSIFTSTVLQPHIAASVRELFRVLRGTEDPFVLTEAYWLLPPNTGVVDPATAGLPNLNIPEWVGWQLAGTPYNISNVVVTATPGLNPPYATVTTSASTPITNGATCLVYGVGGFDPFNQPNGLWIVNAPSPTSIQLNGCTATGTYTSGGQIMAITGQFAQMDPVDQLDRISATTGSNPVATYAWESGVFHFNPSASPMVLRIIYRTSDIVSTSPASIIPIDDCLDYLATRAAGLAASTLGATERAGQLRLDAIGQGEPDGSGGLLRQLVQVYIRNSQRRVYRRKEFRARRNRPDWLLF